MALTVSEAAAVNTLLRSVYGPLPYDDDQLPPQERVDEAALLLAEHANKTLHAGWSRDHLERKIAARGRATTRTPSCAAGEASATSAHSSAG